MLPGLGSIMGGLMGGSPVKGDDDRFKADKKNLKDDFKAKKEALKSQKKAMRATEEGKDKYDALKDLLKADFKSKKEALKEGKRKADDDEPGQGVAPAALPSEPAFTGSLSSPDAQKLLKTADSLIGSQTGQKSPSAAGAMPSSLGSGFSPQAGGSLPGGSGVPGQLTGGNPSSIVDANVMQSLQAGDTTGFINSLASNVQANLNRAAGQFLNLTA